MNSKRPVMRMDSVRSIHATRVRRERFQMFQSTLAPGLMVRILAASSFTQICGSRSPGRHHAPLKMTVSGGMGLDVLRRRGARGEEPLELNVGMLSLDAAADSRTSPEEEALLADSVGLALYVVMDALTPGVPRGGRPGRHRGAARRARPRGRTPGNRPSGGRRRMRRGPDRKPGEGGRAPGHARRPRGRCPGP